MAVLALTMLPFTAARVGQRLCPVCTRVAEHTSTPVSGVYVCGGCRAVHGQCYLGDSYVLVPAGLVAGEADHAYDLTCLGSQGISRRHGWVNAAGKVVQIG